MGYQSTNLFDGVLTHQLGAVISIADAGPGVRVSIVCGA